jgi:hypothetical protein
MDEQDPTVPDLLPVILGEVRVMQEEVREMRSEVRHDLASMKHSLSCVVEMMQQFGLRLHKVERRVSLLPPLDSGGNGGFNPWSEE